jgi:histidinol-phosphatase (PHP family)
MKMQSPGLVDYHLHNAVTVDGRMDEAAACEKALLEGIGEIAFTNHVMLNHPDYTISPASMKDHWANIQACRKQYPQLAIRLGLEVDYYPAREADIKATIDRYEAIIGCPLDLILGSIHEIDGGFFSNQLLAPAFFHGREILPLYEQYFDLATMAAQSGLFDVIAHPDLIKKLYPSAYPTRPV